MPRITDSSFPSASTIQLTDKVLGVVGGIAKNITLSLLKSLIGTTVENSLESDSATNAVSVHQAKLLSDNLANKLDASAYVQHSRGKFVSLVALQTALSTADDGDYAIVDTGEGNDATYFIWDAQDGWVTGGTISGTITDDIVEGATNLYFTNARAISAVISTINTAVAASLDATVNTQTGISYTLQTVDNNGKAYLRMTNTAANTVTIPSSQTKPISISQRGTGTTTLVADSGVTLNGTLAFNAQDQTKTIIPLGSGLFDVVG